MNELRLCHLKRKARRLYLAIHRRSDGLSCGAHLADMIRPDIGRMEKEFESVMDEIRVLDPSAPPKRAAS